MSTENPNERVRSGDWLCDDERGQMTVAELRRELAELPDDLPVFFRAVAPVCGNIREAVSARRDTHGVFGKVLPCVIIETYSSESHNRVDVRQTQENDNGHQKPTPETETK